MNKNEFAEVYYNGDAIIIETDIMELIRVGDPEKKYFNKISEK